MNRSANSCDVLRTILRVGPDYLHALLFSQVVTPIKSWFAMIYLHFYVGSRKNRTIYPARTFDDDLFGEDRAGLDPQDTTKISFAFLSKNGVGSQNTATKNTGVRERERPKIPQNTLLICRGTFYKIVVRHIE